MSLPKSFMFDTEDATKYGVDAAVVLHAIRFWIAKNKANDQNFHDGHYWTYNSKRAWADLFPFYSVTQVRRILDKLVEDNVLITGNYNTQKLDRTLWYAFAQEDENDDQKKTNGKAEKDVMHESNSANGRVDIGSPIPDSIPVKIPDNKKYDNTNVLSTKKNEEMDICSRWNNIAQQWGLSQIRTLGTARKKNLDALLAELGMGLDEFFSTLAFQIAVSLFLRGKKVDAEGELVDKDWRCTFDFLVEPRAKGPRKGIPVIEGKYADPDLVRIYQKRAAMEKEVNAKE